MADLRVLALFAVDDGCLQIAEPALFVEGRVGRYHKRPVGAKAVKPNHIYIQEY